jgi:putative pyruvate formate lyase activating enzyme
MTERGVRVTLGAVDAAALPFPDRDLLAECALCPRECRAARSAGELGWCRTGADLSLGAICLHRGEEPAIGGRHGIANLFFTRCNLCCVHCQNHEISRTRGPIEERETTLREALDEVEALLAGGVRHVGFVSASHAVPQALGLLRALAERRPRPVLVWNSNAYEKPETLRMLTGLVDVFLPDFKYADGDLAERLSGAPDYPEVAARAIREMARQKGTNLLLDDGGLAESGLLVRHLVLPGHVENSLACLRFLAADLGPSVPISLLAQYEPIPAVAGDPDLGRRLRPEEYEAVVKEAVRLGFFRGYTQSLAEAPAHYSPAFRSRHPFEEHDRR